MTKLLKLFLILGYTLCIISCDYDEDWAYMVELEVINTTDHTVDIEFIDKINWSYVIDSMHINPRSTESISDTWMAPQDLSIEKAIITFDNKYTKTHNADDTTIKNSICKVGWCSEPFGKTYNMKYVYVVTEEDYKAAIEKD